MRPYASLWRIRFIAGMQYRAAALAGLATQFAWGFMELLALRAFHDASPGAFPMEFPRAVSYIWLQQALLSLFATWGSPSDPVEAIINGDVAYDLARPLDLYWRWFTEQAAGRAARCALRCAPVALVALMMPEPLALSLPASPAAFLAFLASAVLGLALVSAWCMLDAVSSFYTMARSGLVFSMVAEFFSGAVIPLPFFPEPLRKAAELLPFAGMQNAPLRIYSGDISGTGALVTVALQVFWIAATVLAGRMLMARALRRVSIQGG